MLSFQFINKSYRKFLNKNFLLQKAGTKIYLEQEQDPDPHFFQGVNPDLFFFQMSDPDPVQKRQDPQH
jgi:hypothetical protein